jgi:hypothetical protein
MKATETGAREGNKAALRINPLRFTSGPINRATARVGVAQRLTPGRAFA